MRLARRLHVIWEGPSLGGTEQRSRFQERNVRTEQKPCVNCVIRSPHER